MAEQKSSRAGQLSVKTGFEFGKHVSTKYFQREIYSDESIKDIEYTVMYPNQTYSDASSAKYRFIAEVPDGYRINFDDCYVQCKLAFLNTAAAIASTQKVTLASTFAFFKNAQCWLNTKPLQRVENLPQIRRALTYLTKTRGNLINSNDFIDHFDEPTSNANQATDFEQIGTTTTTSAGVRFGYKSTAMTDGELSLAGLTLTGTVAAAAGNATTWAVNGAQQGNVRTLSFVLEPDTDEFAELRSKNKYGLRRKYATMMNNGTSNTYMFNIPLKFFFTSIESLGKYAYIPATEFQLQLERCDADTEYFIGDGTIDPNINLDTSNGLKLIMNYVLLEDAALGDYHAKVASGDKMTISYLHPEYDTVSVPATTAGRQIRTNLTRANLRYLVEYFNTTTARDPFTYRPPTTWTSTLANNSDLQHKHRWDGKTILPSDVQYVYQPTRGDAYIAYNFYKKACTDLSGNKDDYAITYDEFLRYRPMFVTHIPFKKSIEGLPLHNLTPNEKRLDIEWNASATPSADTQLNIITLKEAYVVIDPKKNTVDTINGSN